MASTQQKLEVLFAKVRALPEPVQERVAEALAEFTLDEAYHLSSDELAILLPELDAAQRGRFAPKSDVDEFLREPWTKART